MAKHALAVPSRSSHVGLQYHPSRLIARLQTGAHGQDAVQLAEAARRLARATWRLQRKMEAFLAPKV